MVKTSCVMLLVFLVGHLQRGSQAHTPYAGCSSGWTGSASLTSCYIAVSVCKDMAGAKRYCFDEYNATVATPKTEPENSFISTLYSGDIRIGIYGNTDQNVWEYYDGNDVNFTVFSSSPFYTAYSTIEDCITMKNDGTWKVESCTTERGFVCQKRLNFIGKTCLLHITDHCSPLGFFRNPYQDICYKKLGREYYNDALDACEAEGLDILMPKSEEEHVFMKWYINDNVWVGLTDIDQEGTFVWNSGIDTGFRAFGYGDQNNAGGDQHCVRYDSISSYNWNDWTCDLRSTIVCQTLGKNYQQNGLICDLPTTRVCQTLGTNYQQNGLICDLPTTRTLGKNYQYNDWTCDLLATIVCQTLGKNNQKNDWTCDRRSTIICQTLGKNYQKNDYTCDLPATIVCQTLSSSFQPAIVETTALSIINTIDFTTDCPCACDVFNITDEYIANYIKKLQKELKVDYQTLSSTIRSRTCAEDPRQSAKNIGMFGVAVLAFVFTIILFMDILSVFQKRYSSKLDETLTG
ncbi:MRC [Mytilus coruscus]|uniref:MRC n=1 Tax=Mytilus coruscus TaxID=42192 RepID=A0A6J7ZZD5_MYTCO|nr:MRC [Mytilus coruscus]